MSLREEIRDKALILGKENPKFRPLDVIQAFEGRVSREYLSTVLRDLTLSGDLVREGGGRSTFYALPGKIGALTSVVRRHLRNEGLSEDRVLEDIERRAGYIRGLPENVYRIFRYAFTEMLNNAIEHSESLGIDIEIYRSGNNLIFTVEDRGIGVFRNVMAKRGLNSELEAMQDILKGKTTTLPEGHSGEGIFFTSKVGDVFLLESYGLSLRADNIINDVFYQEIPPQKGTKVTFIIALDSDRSSDGVFVQYQTDPAEGGFDKTEIRVKLYAGGSTYVSRSQARRIMDGLAGKFKTIILDYDQVPTVGQAFVDEIYRVFSRRHPEIDIKSVNANKVIKFMIDRVNTQ